jgi:DNA-binding LacI/PurR family transcriptional regulator
VTPGHREPTMMDVAARAGVSHQTVSRVLSGAAAVSPDTAARVMAAIGDLGYRRNAAARALARRRSNAIGVVVAELGLFGPSSTVLGIDAAARAAGYTTALVALEKVSHDELTRALRHLGELAVEAVVVVAPSQDLLAAVVRDSAVPIVVVDGSRRGLILSVGVDQMAGAVLATEHLIGLGHRRIAHIRGPAGWTQAESRVQGWRKVLRSHRLASGPLVVGDWTARSGYAAGLSLASHPDVTAVFVANDQMAMGALRALSELGRRVPEDVSVVGFDDLPEAGYAQPPLTTVRQDFSNLGRRAVDVALAALAGEEKHPPLVLPELVVRQSTAPIG